MAVSVRKLVQRGASRNRPRDRIALEDALQATLRDDGRLVLVRRLQISGHVADPARRQDAVRRGWVEAVAGAVHGGNPAAARANCVWFAGRGEAEAILLRKLLAGEPVEGWFWKLAIPDWDGPAANEWLRGAVAACLLQSDAGRFAILAETCVSAGHAGRLIEAIERALALPDDRFGQAAAATVDTVAERVIEISPTGSGDIVRKTAAKLAPLVLPGRWRETLDRLERSRMPEAAKARVIGAILREKLRRASPALSLEPNLLDLVAQAIRNAASGNPAKSPAKARSPPDEQPTPPPPPGQCESSGPIESRHLVLEPEVLRHPRPSTPSDQTDDPPQRRMESRSDPAGFGNIRASRHAGLWLVVPSLIRLGFREWLADQRQMLGESPGRSLILAVARRHRVSADDPALAVFLPVEEDEQLPEWTESWRIGLDRWLRRSAGRRTHDLVARPGSLALGEERVDIHFPLGAADLSLRRRALDCDPGWTDWLGLSIRYHFDAAGAQ